MDNKNFFQALFWALLIFLAWTFVAQRIWPPPPKPTPGTEQVAPADESPTDAGPSKEPPVESASDEHESAAEDSGEALSVRAVAAPETVTLGTTDGFEKSPYRMQIVLTNREAAIETVDLSNHRQDVYSDKRYRLVKPLEIDGRVWTSLGLEAVNIDGERVDLEGSIWEVSKERGDASERATFTTSVERSGTPVLELERTFTLPQQPSALLRHDVNETITIRNLTTKPQQVVLVQRGPVGISSASGSVKKSYMPDQKLYAAKRVEGYVELDTQSFQEVAKRKKPRLYPESDVEAPPLIWQGGANQYFSCTQCPVNQAGQEEGDRIRSVVSVDLDDDVDTHDDATSRVTTRAITVPAGEVSVLVTKIYLGPKNREAFEDPRNEDYVAWDFMAEIKDGYGTCTFNFLTDIMIGMLNWFYGVVGNFGIAIFCLVIIVRALLHPLTKKTQVNMMKMQQRMAVLHPKSEAIKAKFKGDNARLQQELMKLYREEGVNPATQGVSSCLPMMLQMPIWVALYSSLRNNVAMRCEGFFWWIRDLTQPDVVYQFGKPIVVPILGWQIEAFHLLPILVGVMMFAQQKLMPKPKPAVAHDSPQAEQAEQMQKIMPYMSLMMIIIFYNFPSGLNLYIMTSSLIGTLEQLYIRKHIKNLEEAGPAQKPARPKKQRKGPTFLKWLEKKAEEAQKVQSQRDQRNKRR